MVSDPKFQHDMNSALDHDLAEQERQALDAHLEESAERAEHWERLRKTDHLLRTTPKELPAAGFASRVMAALAAMPLHEFAKRRLSVGVALGLIAAALLTLPILSALFILLFKFITDPGAVNAFFRGVTGGTTYLLGLASDLENGMERVATATPVVPALLSAVIPLSMLWVWLVRSLWSGRLAAEREVV